MKLRIGFVSNSSSSSFMVAGPKGCVPTVVVEMELPYDEQITSQKELDAYVMENWSSNGDTLEEILSDEYYRNKYDECLTEINRGNVIYLGSVSSEGSTEEQYLHDNGIGDNLKHGVVIQDCD